MPDIEIERDSRLEKDIDREIDGREKEEERIKSAVEGVLRETDIKAESKEAVIITGIMRDIEKSPVKSDDFKELQQGFAAELLIDRDVVEKEDLKTDILETMDRVEANSEYLAYASVVENVGRDDERDAAMNLIENILNDDKGLADEKTAACHVVVDMLNAGVLRDFDPKDTDKILERAVEEGRSLLHDREDKKEPERNILERTAREEALVKEISDDNNRFERNPVAAYVLERGIKEVERNPLYDDKFKNLQEDYLTSYLKDAHTQRTLTTESMERLTMAAERDAFQTSLMELCNEGKLNREVAQDIAHDIELRDPEERSGIMAAALDMVKNGELRDVSYEGREEKTPDDEKRLSDLVDKLEKDGQEREKSLEINKKDENAEKIESVVREIGAKDGLEKDVRDAAASIYDNRFYSDDLKSSISDKMTELLKDKEVSKEDIKTALADAEKQVIIDRITDGKERLSPSQERAVSYVEKTDRSADERSAKYAAVLDAYEKGLIPDKEDISKRQERSVSHNIDMDAKDRMAVSRLDGQERDIIKEFKEKHGAELTEKNDTALRAGVSRIEKSFLSDDLKEEQRDKFMGLFAEKMDKDYSGRDVKKMLDESERSVLVDRITSRTGSIDSKEKENAVAVIDKISASDMKSDDRTAAYQAALNMFSRGDMKDDDKDKLMQRAVNEGRENKEKEELRKNEVLAASIKKEPEKDLKDEKGKDVPREEKTKEPEKQPEKDKAPEKDKNERPIGVDPDKDARDESKSSKQAWFMDAKEVWEKAADIYERKVLSANHHTDTTLSHQERDIVQRSIKLREELIDKNNAEKAQLIEKSVKLQKDGKEVPKETVERLGKLEKYNIASEREIYKMKQMVDPDYIKARQLTRPIGESKDHLKKELETKTVYPDPSDKRLFHFREEALHWRNHPGIMERVTYESCLYAGLTGRRPSSVAGKDISTFEVRNNSLPALCFTKAAQDFRHSEGMRMYLEIFKIDGRKAKPLEINNVCAVLDRINRSDADEKMKESQRVILAELCKDGKIANVKQNDTYRNNLYEKVVRAATDKTLAKDPIKEGLEREERKESLREKLSKTPEQTDREIIKYVLAAKEPVDLQALLEISRDTKDKMLEQEAKEGTPHVPMEAYELSKQELKQIVCGPNPEALSVLYSLNYKMPAGAELNPGMYERAVSVIKGTNEKNDVIKMAMVNFALSKDGSFRSLDGEEGQRLAVVEKNATLLVKSTTDISQKHELVKIIRGDLREKVAADRAEQRDVTRRELRPIDYDRPPEKILKDTSRYIGNICRSEEYSRDKMEDKLREVRDGMRYHRSVFYEDFKSIRTKDRGLKPNDAIAVVERDPRMLLGIQRAGISIGMNGLINETRLNDTIMKLETIPREDINLRMAVLEKNFVQSKNGSMNLSNAINMGTREDTRDVNNMALWLYARDNNLKFREPADPREKEALDRNIAALRGYESKERVEKAFVTNLMNTYSDRDLSNARTFASINRNMMPVLALAVKPDYEERLISIVADLKARSDADSVNVKESIQILETLSRLSEQRSADTANNRTVFNRSYDENGKVVDVSLESRMVAIRTVEKIKDIPEKVFDAAGISRLNGHNVSAVYDSIRDEIDLKANRLHVIFKDQLPTTSQTEVVREYMARDSYNSKLKINNREDPENDKKVDFLVNMGFGREISAGKDENGVSYLYTQDNLSKIDSLYRDVSSRVDCIRDNFNHGNLSEAAQREHVASLNGLSQDLERAGRHYQYIRDEMTVGKDNLPRLMIDIEKKDNVAIREEGLKNIPMYTGADNYVSLSRNETVNTMNFIKNTAFYDYPIDMVRPSMEVVPFAMSADDVRTIMDNREHIVDCGIHYSIDFSNGYDRPMFSASGLNDISVSNLSDVAYRAIARSCSPEEFKTLESMRHDKDLYKAAKDAATAYQKYYVDFSRETARTPENFERNVQELCRYFDIIHDARMEVMKYGKPSDDLSDKTAAYIAIEYSRQQLFSMAPKDALSEAINRWGEQHNTTILTAEHSAKTRYDEMVSTAYEERLPDIGTPYEVALELSQRLGYDFEDYMSFFQAYENGLITDEEFNMASLNYDIYKDIEEQEFLQEYAREQTDEYDREPGPAPMPDDYREDYRDEYQDNYRGDDSSMVYSTDEDERNTPFANLFAGFNFGFGNENPVLGEDEISMGQQDFDDSAYVEDNYDDFNGYDNTPDMSEYYDEHVEDFVTDPEIERQMAEQVAELNRNR